LCCKPNYIEPNGVLDNLIISLTSPFNPLGFGPLLKITLGNPFLEIFGLAKLFVADALMKKKTKKI